MAVPRFAWGIDIGNRALKAVKLVPGGPSGLSVDDFEVIEHETVLSEAGDNRESLITSALANFVQRHPGVEKGQVGIGVSGQQSFARFIKLPPVEDKRIPEIVRFEAIQQIPFPLDDVEWSYQLFREADSPEVEVGIFAMRKELINANLLNFTSIDLNVQVVQMNPLAVYNAMYYDSRVNGTTMIIDVGAENTDLIIADGETVWLRTISMGGNNFTEALTKAFKVNFAKAEDLKRNASTSKYGRQIMQAMRPNFADLVSEIQRSMGFYASTHRDAKINKVIALGNTFRLPGLQRYLQQNLQLDVEKIDGLTAGAPSDPKLAASFSENLLSVGSAYGLALQVMGQGKITSSLLPEHIRRETMWRSKTKWFAAAAAIFAVGAVIPYGAYYYNNWSLQQRADVEDQIKLVQNQAQALDTKWSEIEQAGGSDRQRITNVDALLEYRGLTEQLIKGFYDALPQAQPDAPKALVSGDAQQIKSIPRGQRTQIMLDKITSRYVPDVATIVADPDLGKYADESTGPGENGGGSSIPTPTGEAAAASTGARGYLVTVQCTTPNAEGYDFVERAFVEKMLAMKPGTIPAGQQYCIGKAVIARKIRVGDDPVRMQEMATAYAAKLAAQQASQQSSEASTPRPGMPVLPPGMSGGMPPGMGGGMPPGGFGGGGYGDRGMGDRGGFGGGGGFSPPGVPGGGIPGGAAAANTLPVEAYEDPLLHEDVRDDTECTIVFLVLLDPSTPAVAEAIKTAANAGTAQATPATPSEAPANRGPMGMPPGFGGPPGMPPGFRPPGMPPGFRPPGD